MELDPELLKKLLATFADELNEQCQSITTDLLNLEKNQHDDATIQSIFRSAHNIKGAARGIGVKDVGEIAHHLETLFTNIQKKSKTLTPTLIDRCLEAVDNMRISLQAFIDKKPLSFDLNEFLARLTSDEPVSSSKEPANPTKKQQTSTVVSTPNKDSESIRVAINNLDRVSSLTEEVQVTKIALDDHYSELNKLTMKSKQLELTWKEAGVLIHGLSSLENENALQQIYSDSADGFIEISNTLRQLNQNMRRHLNELTSLSNALLEEVRLLRLIPASTLFSTFPRTVREIAQELNKQVEIDITGESRVKMDKMVLEGLQDPINHLLRNAIDHGIEKPDIRQAKGKPPVGHIHIDVREQGDTILISISDDGAGIDIPHIAKTAIAKQIMTEAECAHASDETLLDLIFRPGFTTKEIITDVSGRGIGMDVVKSNIDNLKGQIHIQTEKDKGTTFYLRVPLTLASERGLLIQSGGQPFVIPTNLIERVLHLSPSDIIDVEATQAILIDKIPIPLRTLSDVLGLPRKHISKQDTLSIIVLKKGWHAIALFVEEILNEREIVIKSLQTPLSNIPCIAGGTLGGDGQVIIVLNSNDLIDRALHIGKSSPITLSDETSVAAPSRPRILVVDDSITTRTLEKNILENKNYHVTVAVNGKEAWDLLQNQTFSLLITDVSMPIMDGFTLTERVKQSEALRNMPVIIVTSLGSDAEKKRGIDVGANAYIIKNEFESDKLLQIVEQLV